MPLDHASHRRNRTHLLSRFVEKYRKDKRRRARAKDAKEKDEEKEEKGVGHFYILPL